MDLRPALWRGTSASTCIHGTHRDDLVQCRSQSTRTDALFVCDQRSQCYERLAADCLCWLTNLLNWASSLTPSCQFCFTEDSDSASARTLKSAIFTRSSQSWKQAANNRTDAELERVYELIIHLLFMNEGRDPPGMLCWSFERELQTTVGRRFKMSTLLVLSNWGDVRINKYLKYLLKHVQSKRWL